MIGVGGISMSGFAKFLLFRGKIVSGSDLKKNDIIEDLEKNGLIFFNNHSEKNITKDIDLVVYSGAIQENNSELKMAKKLKIPCIERSLFLGAFSKLFKKVIAISGSHGKTTTTALLGKILLASNLNPTIALGGEYSDLNCNFILGGSNILVCEACEYRESFKYLKPDISVITNIEPEHLDYYKNFNNELSAFCNFANSSKISIVDENCDILSTSIKVGKNEKSNYCYSGICYNNGKAFFNVYCNKKLIGNFSVGLLGEHNVKNALFAIVVSLELGIDKTTIQIGLDSFKGVKRRNEFLTQIDNTPIVCDYAHHPTEIMASISNAKLQFKKIMCVFQPHTYSRTSTLIEDFKGAFDQAYELVLFKTYAAREKYDSNGSEVRLFQEVNIKRKKLFMRDLELIRYIKTKAKNFDLVLVLGAGDIYDIIKENLVN